MATDPAGCGIVRSGSSGSYTYSVAAEKANLPVNNLTIGSAMRFCNWLHNGQPVGDQNASPTEDGAYTLNGATSDALLAPMTRNVGAKYFLPTDDEWYKAAFYKGDTETYNLYPTNTSTKPGTTLPDATGNNANYGSTIYSPNTTARSLSVGSFESTTSYYGAYDMGGNLAEYTEIQGTGSAVTRKLLLGGNYTSSTNAAALAINGNSLSWFAPSSLNAPYGFRVFAAVPEPGTLAMLVMGAFGMGLFAWKKRR